MFDFYRFVHDSRWIGGSTEYSALDEASPYWFNGLVPLAFGLGDKRLKGQVKYYLDYVLDHQQGDGWLGFETTRATRGLWARCLLLLGLIVSSLDTKKAGQELQSGFSSLCTSILFLFWLPLYTDTVPAWKSRAMQYDKDRDVGLKTRSLS